MKDAADYLAQALREQAAEHQAQGYCPLSFDEPITWRVLRKTAERAVELALADAETYKTHLVGAVLRSRELTTPGSNDVAITLPASAATGLLRVGGRPAGTPLRGPVAGPA